MRKKGHPHGELSDEEKVFLARVKAGNLKRRREQIKQLKKKDKK